MSDIVALLSACIEKCMYINGDYGNQKRHALLDF